MPMTINGTGTIGGLSVGGLPVGTVNSTTILDGSILPVDTQVGALPSMVRLNTANGYGSTNTAIRRFTNTVTNQGTDITYADSATLGGSFTINTNGVYAIYYADQFNVAQYLGITLNTTQPTVAVVSLTNGSEIVSITAASAANVGASTSSTMYLPSGSIIRAHAGSVASGANVIACQFTITRVA